ncbi:MAG: Rpn family recombination-promoting nuclease/putative transposase [Microcystis flos-aquae TF09]|jgi:predicted transposase/invertase (TIGR01784 family)|uniref:Rpn family recombination-promoting nuclease/putative transposase n=1 Tax=Microcystis flos-aquae TF09 TaxID=2060473 RepID=A0A3E0L6U5_9CHRO|nr:Rpn family recombination-promoting nuclease/putative transposase [Microcystis aeruginosa]MBE9244151.1 Rpn family recombination-promoting nuclease/putative transposase [Microcystis aeruginosa LEGE 00239]REJ43135.1 MAG: Rpn family recombination-promoting nuclease/putative transposase [Microcystis flos-aquae TF09]
MYDNVCKFLAENYSRDFAQWLLGEPISFTQLSPSELSLEPIRADALILLESDQIILHLEFQTDPDPKMSFRMLDYRTRVYRRFPKKTMRQVVIYLKETSSPLVRENAFILPNTRHEYEVLRLWEIPAEKMLGLSGLLPLANLGKTPNRPEILRQVAAKIDNIEGRTEKSNLAAATAILAGLVLSKEIIGSLLREEIMRESVIYQDIRESGKAQGRREEAVSLILRLLNRRLGEISSTLSQQIRELSLEQLETLGEALLDFTSLTDLTAWLLEIET